MDKILEYLKQLEARLAAIENAAPQLAQRVVDLESGFASALQSIQDANAEYADDQQFGEFDAQNGEAFGDLPDRLKTLNGEDFDLKRQVYEQSKGQEDVPAFVKQTIDQIEAALVAAVKADPAKAEEIAADAVEAVGGEVVPEEGAPSVITEEQSEVIWPEE